MRTGIFAIAIVFGLAGAGAAQTVDQIVSDGKAALEGGRFGEAVTLCRQAVSREPSHFEAQYCLAMACLRGDRFDNAVSEFKRAATMQPRNGQVWFHLAEAYHGLRQGDLTIGSLRKAIQFDQGNANFHLRLAWAYVKYDEPVRAQAEYEQIVGQHPSNAEAWEGLAEVHEKQKQYKPAVEAWKRCLEVTRAAEKRREIQARIDAIEKRPLPVARPIPLCVPAA